MINLAQLTPIIIESSSSSTSVEHKKSPNTQAAGQTSPRLKPDTVTISESAKQQLDISSPANTKKNRSLDNIANEIVRVSSSIGQAHSQGSLNAQEADKLYHEIAALL